MKSYLILMKNKSKDKVQSKSERFDYYKTWGKYLSQFSEDKLIGGGPLKDEAFSLIAKTEGFIEMQDGESSLDGYIIVKASSIEELKNDLMVCPIFENEYSRMSIHEVDLRGLI